jgi:hypothetical protein
MERPLHLLDLPSEITHHIFSYLTITAILPVCTTSKFFNELIAQIVEYRQYNAARLRDQTLCYHLYQPIDRFGTPLVRCLTRTTTEILAENRLGRGRQSASVEAINKLHEQYTFLTPKTESYSVMFYDTRANGPDELTERRIQFDGRERFAQMMFKIEIIQYGEVDGRCSGSSMVRDGVVRVFRNWLNKNAGRNEDSPDHSDTLWLDDAHHIGFQTSVRRSAGHTRYYLKIHGKLDRSCGVAQC